MELEDFAQPEVGVAVAATAIATSPSIRKTLRKGAAYGLAGVLLAGDATHRFVNAIAKGARSATHSLPNGEHVTRSSKPSPKAAKVANTAKAAVPVAEAGAEVAESA